MEDIFLPDEYYINIFKNMEDKMRGNGWFNIPLNKPDREKIIAAMKKRIDMYGDFIFNSDYTQIRRAERYDNSLDDTMIGFKIIFDSMDSFDVDYSQLPPPVFSDPIKKKGRAV